MSAKDYHRFIRAAEVHAKEKVAHLKREPSASEDKAALEETFFEWLEDHRYDELTAFLHREYGSLGQPNYFEFVRELGRDLAKRNDTKRLHALFRGILPGCYREFWIEWKHAEQGLLGNIAVSGGANIDVIWRTRSRHGDEAPPMARFATGGLG